MSLQPVSFRKGRAHLPRLSKPYVPGKHDPRFDTAEQDLVGVLFEHPILFAFPYRCV